MPPPVPKIIAVHSYRGGTGKSNLTANLATALAVQGKRVGVIDTDIQSPGIHNLFDLDGGSNLHTLNDFLWGDRSIEETVHDVSAAAGIQMPGRIYLVPASTNPDDIARILSEGYSVSLLNEGIRQLIKTLDLNYFLIDTHPGLSKETFLSIAISNIMILVLRPDRQDYQGTAVMIDLARQLKVPQILLVANKVLKELDYEDFQQQLERTYETPVVGIFSISTEMLRLGSNGIFFQEHPTHSWSTTLLKLANRVIDLTQS
jgi:MinD-like ATPase involved in chromosome partitioning or flagellar assembly